ncbi:MAG: hypothetical protein FWC51_03610 [Proteobacteria bacterium]|nr:hypothetical protein [Pseudomonadota bacterium]
MKKKSMLVATLALTGMMAAGAAVAMGLCDKMAKVDAQLTDQQRECLNNHGCPTYDKNAEADCPANAAARVCAKTAFAECGLDLPMRNTKAAGTIGK